MLGLEHILCYAHGLHIGILIRKYDLKTLDQANFETNSSEKEEDSDSDESNNYELSEENFPSDFSSSQFYYIGKTSEKEFNENYADNIIDNVRKIIKLIRKSPL